MCRFACEPDNALTPQRPQQTLGELTLGKLLSCYDQPPPISDNLSDSKSSPGLRRMVDVCFLDREKQETESQEVVVSTSFLMHCWEKGVVHLRGGQNGEDHPVMM